MSAEQTNREQLATMNIVPELCDFSKAEIKIVVRSNAGFDQQKPSLAIDELMHGGPAKLAVEHARLHGVNRPAIKSKGRYYPVNHAGTPVHEVPEGADKDLRQIAGYQMEIIVVR